MTIKLFYGRRDENRGYKFPNKITDFDIETQKNN